MAVMQYKKKCRCKQGMCIADYFDLVDKVDNELTALIMKFSETDVNLKYVSTPYIESTHFLKWGLTHPPTHPLPQSI